jgi:putative methyltransferase (TIGR04325 family)
MFAGREVKNIIRLVTPPVFWQAGHWLKRRTEFSPFEGPFSSWEEAVSRSTGWNNQSITSRTLQSALQVRDGAAPMERDGVVSYDRIYSNTILGFLILVLSTKNDNISIIDFGGGLGANYFQNLKIFYHLNNKLITWNVVERRDIAKLGTLYFENNTLKFFERLDDVFGVSPTDNAIVFSGSLQCVEQPFDILDKVIRNGIKIIALDRLFISKERSEHKVFVQRPDPKIYYPASYPVWCFSKDSFITTLEAKGFKMIELFTEHMNFDQAGMIFTRQS